MIGDWVNIMVEGYDNPTQIKEIGPFWVKVTQDEKDYEIVLIEPIPITPEILEKNGFVLESDGWVYYQNPEIKQQDYICVSFRHNDEPRSVEINFIHKAQCVFRQIYEVHELQHALKICGVSKNIEL